MGQAPARTPAQIALDEYNAVVNNRTATPEQKAAAKAKYDADMARIQGDKGTTPQQDYNQSRTGISPEQLEYANAQQGGNWLTDFFDYTADKVTLGPVRRAADFAANGDWDNFWTQVANTGGTPIADKLVGRAEGDNTHLPLHDTQGNWTGPEAIGDVRDAVLGVYGIPKDTKLAAGGGGGGIGASGMTAQTQADRDLALMLLEDQIRKINAGQSYQAPTVTAPQIAGVKDIDPAQVAGTSWLQAAQVSAPGAIKVTTPTGLAQVQAQQVAAPGQVQADKIGPVQQVASRDVVAPTVAPVKQATATTFTGQQIDKSGANRVQGRQDAALDLLEAAATGRAPSAAEAQLRRESDEIANRSLALARSGPGSAKASLSRQALRDNAELGFKTNLAASEIRAKESESGRTGLASTLTDVRNTDTGIAKSQAELDQAAKDASARLLTGVSQSNSSEANARDLALAQLEAQIAEGNAGRSLSASTGNADRALQARSADVTNALTAATGNRDANTAVTVGNADRALAAATTSAKAFNDREALVAQLKTDAAKQDAANTIAVATGNADRKLTADSQSASNSLAAQTTNAGLRQDAAKTSAENKLQTQSTNANLNIRGQEANQGASLQGQQLNQNREQNLTGNALQALSQAQHTTGQEMGLADSQADRDLKKDAANRAAIGTTVAGVVDVIRNRNSGNSSSSSGGYTAPKDDDDIFRTTSDSRAKDHIRPESPAAMDDLLDAIEAVTFAYKDGEGPPGRKHGILADDLERSEMGRDMVKRDTRGVKKVDTDQLVMALAGVVAEQNRKLKKLEKRA